MEQLRTELSGRANINCLGYYDFEPDRVAHLVDAAKARGIDCVIVWGGDGSVACIANELHATGIPILPLPGGTMNLLHKRVHGDDSDWQSCLNALTQTNKPYEMRPGKLNDRLFYVAAMFGTLTQLAEVRESVRDKNPLQAASNLLQGDALDMRSQVKFKLSSSGGEQNDTAVAVAAFVTDDPNNPLKVGVIDPNSLLDLSSVGLDALLNGWEEADKVDQYCAQSLTVEHTADEILPYTLDGEQYESDQAINVGVADSAITFLSLRFALCD